MVVIIFGILKNGFAIYTEDDVAPKMFFSNSLEPSKPMELSSDIDPNARIGLFSMGDSERV